MNELVTQAKQLLEEGVYDPDALFEILSKRNRKHYATVRRAIHIAKAGIFR